METHGTASPSDDPRPPAPRPTPTRRRIALAAAAVLLAAPALFALFVPRVTTEEVRWRNGGVELAGTLHLPRGGGPHPAVVLVHGYGCAERSDPFFLTHARRLAGRERVAVLAYDKRGCGESTGGHWREATLLELAEDALGGVRLLAEHPRIDAARIGLLGTSLGGSVALIAADRSADVAFLATVSISLQSPVEHGHFIAAERLRRKGYSDEVAERASELSRRIADVYRTGRGWEELEAELARVRDEPWFRDSGVSLHPEPPGTWETVRDLPMDHDDAALLARLEIPFFAAQGEEDWLVPGPRAAAEIEELAREHGKDFTVVLVPRAEHSLRAPSRLPWKEWTWPESYWRALGHWLDEAKA